MTATPPLTTTPRTGEAATTPTGKWLQDQLHDDATAFYALTSRQYSIANFVVKVQDLIPQIEREAAAQPAPPAEALRLLRDSLLYIEALTFGSGSRPVALIDRLRRYLAATDLDDDPISDSRQPEDGPPPGRWPR